MIQRFYGPDRDGEVIETIQYERASYHINTDPSKSVVVKVWVAGSPQQYEDQVAEDFMSHRTQGMVIQPYPRPHL